MVVIFNPKEDFKASPDAKLFHDLVAQSWFQRAGLAALQHYSDMQTKASSTGDLAAACYAKITGAREFWGVFLNLTETPETSKKSIVQNLDRI